MCMTMDVTLLGTGVGIPHSGRAQAGLVLKAKESLLFDCGAGALLRLAESGVDPTKIDTVLLSHLHLDHVSDLLPLAKARWLVDEKDFTIYGPAGTEDWFRAAQNLYPYLDDLKVAVLEVGPKDEFSVKGFRIVAAEAVHSVVALGYRAEYGMKSVVYSGDTEPTASIARLAKGADLLVHECSFPEPYQVTNHSTPLQLGEVLQGVNVKRIVLTHLYPETIGHEEEMVKDIKAGLDPEVRVEVGRDLQRIRL